jgi:hypothetical protein
VDLLVKWVICFKYENEVFLMSRGSLAVQASVILLNVKRRLTLSCMDQLSMKLVVFAVYFFLLVPLLYSHCIFIDGPTNPGAPLPSG